MFHKFVSFKFVLFLLGCFLLQPTYALDSDRDQPATLEADDFEIDLGTGVRIYRGNVVFRQGSILLECDELETHLNDDGGLEKGICVGSPGRFKQRPQGAKHDIVGVARKITMDEIDEIVVLKSQVKVTQGGTQISGRTVTYDLVTEKIKVKGGSQTASSAKKQDSGEASSDGTAQADQGSSRPSLVIQPRKKKKQ